MTRLNETHDPSSMSWVASANSPGCDFPIQNLPFGVFRRRGSYETFRCGVAIGDQILDLAAAQALLQGECESAMSACSGSTLNALLALGAGHWTALRLALSRALRAGAPQAERLAPCLVPQQQAEYSLPAQIGDYTDFYSSIFHATTVGRMFRPDNPLMPNYKWLPVA